MRLLALSANDMNGLVSMQEASEAMKRAFAALSLGAAQAPPRSHVESRAVGGKTLLMGACIPDQGLTAKVVSFFPRNPERGLPSISGMVLVMDEQSGVPVAVCEGSYLTALRTGAGTCASIELLARSESQCGLLIGAGGQARMQLVAIDTARQLETLFVCSRNREHAARLIAEMQPRVRASLQLASHPDEVLATADVVIAATSSATPVVRGALLRRGAHVVAIGSVSEAMREVDESTIRRSRIFVDSTDGACQEAGELIDAVRRGITNAKQWTELGSVAAARAPGRQNDEEVTFFKSVGHAVQDVAIAALIVERAKSRNLGTTLEL